MKNTKINAKFTEFPISPSLQHNSSAIIPTVKGNAYCKYGEHAYYFLNFKTLKGLRITISHKDIILPGLKKFIKANYKQYKLLPRLRSLFQSYHYDFNFLEQIMLMTVPHTVTEIKDGRFFINLWSYFGYLDIDCQNRTATYVQTDKEMGDHVLGSQQIYDEETESRYYMSYSLEESMKRATNTDYSVFCNIVKEEQIDGQSRSIWSGQFIDYIHDIVINDTRQYCVISELGMFKDKEGNLIPSKVLILDLKNNNSWIIDKFIVAAHAQFDPDEPDVIYFSNHNFEFQHSSLISSLKNAMYKLRFNGPASVYKYQLTPDGPKELAVFTDPDFYRLTNFHVFKHRGQKLLAAMGSPNFLYIADAETMKFIRKIEVLNPEPEAPCIIGTFSPSIDGEKLFVHTDSSFQAVDIETGNSEVIMAHDQTHSCSNHMITSTDVNW